MKGIGVCTNEKLHGFELGAPPHVQIWGVFRLYTLLYPSFTLSKIAKKCCTLSEHDTYGQRNRKGYAVFEELHYDVRLRVRRKSCTVHARSILKVFFIVKGFLYQSGSSPRAHLGLLTCARNSRIFPMSKT